MVKSVWLIALCLLVATPVAAQIRPIPSARVNPNITVDPQVRTEGQIAQLRAKVASLQIQLTTLQAQLKDLGAKTVTYQCRDQHTASNSRGATSDCGVYLCDPVQGLCKTQCSTSADCISGTTCDQQTGICVYPSNHSS